MAKSHVWRTYPKDRVDPDVLRSYGQDAEERMDEAADYIEHLEDELRTAKERVEELEEGNRAIQSAYDQAAARLEGVAL